jgi:hypothetical protein
MIFRLLARRCKIGPREARKLTFSQAINLIRADDPESGDGGSSAGGVELTSPSQIDEILRSLRDGDDPGDA